MGVLGELFCLFAPHGNINMTNPLFCPQVRYTSSRNCKSRSNILLFWLIFWSESQKRYIPICVCTYLEGNKITYKLYSYVILNILPHVIIMSCYFQFTTTIVFTHCSMDYEWILFPIFLDMLTHYCMDYESDLIPRFFY